MQSPNDSNRLPLSLDYPRMMFHQTRNPVTVHSREEEDFLGFEWSRTIWPAEAPEPELFTRAGQNSALDPGSGPGPEPEKEVSPDDDALPAKPPPIRAKTAKKKH